MRVYNPTKSSGSGTYVLRLRARIGVLTHRLYVGSKIYVAGSNIRTVLERFLPMTNSMHTLVYI